MKRRSETSTPRFETVVDLLRKADLRKPSLIKTGRRQNATMTMHDGSKRVIRFVLIQGRWEPLDDIDLRTMREADVVVLDDGTMIKNRFGPV